MKYEDKLKDYRTSRIEDIVFDHLHENQNPLERYHLEVPTPIEESRITTNSPGTEFWPSDCCKDSEKRHSSLLISSSNHYRRGYIILLDDLVIGHLKLHRDRTFLAYQTTASSRGIETIKGGLYLFPKDLANELARIRIPNRTWGFARLDSLSLEPKRPIREDYSKVSKESPTIRRRIDIELEKIKRIISLGNQEIIRIRNGQIEDSDEEIDEESDWFLRYPPL